ncbi:MAG TPA: hypothetical protein VGQ90_15850 [Stellaceae bacterium]|jgi:hypothetical protein|nr:hypothetical protein [Stellaceae bacterium]
MITLPKLLLLVLVAFAAWYAVRWINRPPPRVTRRREARAGGQAAVEDLTACRVCGAYVAASARSCGKPSCPLPR